MDKHFHAGRPVDYNWIDEIPAELRSKRPRYKSLPQARLFEQGQRFLLGIGGSLLGFAVGVVTGFLLDIVVAIVRAMTEAQGKFNMMALPIATGITGLIFGYFILSSDFGDTKKFGWTYFHYLTFFWMLTLAAVAVFGFVSFAEVQP